MMILKWIFKQWDGAWTGLIRLTIGTGGGLLSNIKFSQIQRYVTLGLPWAAAKWQDNYENTGILLTATRCQET
jgi:hypothetical protein